MTRENRRFARVPVYLEGKIEIGPASTVSHLNVSVQDVSMLGAAFLINSADFSEDLENFHVGTPVTLRLQLVGRSSVSLSGRIAWLRMVPQGPSFVLVGGMSIEMLEDQDCASFNAWIVAAVSAVREACQEARAGDGSRARALLRAVGFNDDTSETIAYVVREAEASRLVPHAHAV